MTNTEKYSSTLPVFELPAYLAGKEVTQEPMKELGPVILMDGKLFERDLPARDAR